MCLRVSEKATERERAHLARHGERVYFKVVDAQGYGKYRGRGRGVRYVPGKVVEARGRAPRAGASVVEGGGLHVFKTKAAAEGLRVYGGRVLRVIGKAADFQAAGTFAGRGSCTFRRLHVVAERAPATKTKARPTSRGR